MFRVRVFFGSPVKLGVTISFTLLLVLLLSETFLDRWPGIADRAREGALSRQSEGGLRDLRIAIVHCLLIGYLPAALLGVLQGGRRTVRALQGALDCSPEECDLLAASVRFDAARIAIASLVGLALGFSAPYVTPPVPEALWNPATWTPEVAWHRVLGPLVAVGSVLLVYAIVAVSRRMSQLAADLESIDLFDLDPLRPFAQQGLVNALLLMGYVALTGLMVLTETGFGLLGLVIGTGVLGAAGLSLALPLRGVHRRIVGAKEAELAWVNVALRDQRTVLRGGAERTSGDLADLAAYRELVRSVPDWPIGTSSYIRFGLYLLIPVASWAAAALAERWLDTLL